MSISTFEELVNAINQSKNFDVKTETIVLSNVSIQDLLPRDLDLETLPKYMKNILENIKKKLQSISSCNIGKVVIKVSPEYFIHKAIVDSENDKLKKSILAGEYTQNETTIVFQPMDISENVFEISKKTFLCEEKAGNLNGTKKPYFLDKMKDRETTARNFISGLSKSENPVYFYREKMLVIQDGDINYMVKEGSKLKLGEDAASSLGDFMSINLDYATYFYIKHIARNKVGGGIRRKLKYNVKLL